MSGPVASNQSTKSHSTLPTIGIIFLRQAVMLFDLPDEIQVKICGVAGLEGKQDPSRPHRRPSA